MSNHQNHYSEIPLAKHPLLSFGDWISLLAAVASLIALFSVGSADKPTLNTSATNNESRQTLSVMVDPMGSQTQPSATEPVELPMPAY